MIPDPTRNCLASSAKSALMNFNQGGTYLMTATPLCNGVTRRDVIRLGTASVFGMGFGLPAILQAQERAAARGQSPRDISLIFLFLHGGMSTIDTWDLKPNAPQEFRGEFSPIQTN